MVDVDVVVESSKDVRKMFERCSVFPLVNTSEQT